MPRLPISLLLLFLFLLYPGARLAQSPAPVAASPQTSSASSSGDQNEALVWLDVQVVREDTGEAVTRLGRKDFQIIEDGFKREVRQLTYDRWPLSIVFVVDVSKNFQPAIAPLVKDLDLALNKLKAKDEIALIAFNETSEIAQEFTTDRRLFAQRFFPLTDPQWQKKPGKKQDLPGAIARASELMSKARPTHRRVIIVLSQETLFTWLPRIRENKLAGIRDIMASDSTISGLMLTKEMSGFTRFLTITSATPVAYDTQPLVRIWADRTGGEVFGGSREGLASGLGNLIERLHQRVLVGFIPNRATKDGSYHSLDLHISTDLEQREGPVIVRVREGYFAGAPQLTSNKPVTRAPMQMAPVE